MLHLWRYFWPLPWTLVGLVAAVLVRSLGGQWQRADGALEAYGGAVANCLQRLPPTLRFDAITLGHVILGVDAQTLESARAHEQVHLRQYERWGFLFVPAYMAASVWLWLRGDRPYRDNPFERQAYAQSPITAVSSACADIAKME